MTVLLAGFVTETRTAMRFQAQGPPGAEHPYDWQAWACLSGAMVLLGVLFLTRPAPRRWRKTPKYAQNLARTGSKAAKRRRRSGYNRANDT